MPYSVEGFGKIESDEYDIGIGSKEMGYSVEDIYDGSSSGACWPVRKLVGERQGWGWGQEGSIDILPDYDSLHHTGENWCNGDWTVI